jgi:actin-like ATPase involved in cell morphogenesis
MEQMRKVLDEWHEEVDRRLRQPANRILETIEQIRAMKFPPELEGKIAAEIRRLRGAGYRDKQLERIVRACEALKKTLSNMAIG